MRLHRRFVAFVAAVGLAVAGLVASGAAPAAASGSTYNYIVMPTWQGNCPSGGRVVWVGATSWSQSATGYAADWGDDIVYLRVGYYENVNIVGNVRCQLWWGGTYNGPAVSVWIYPTRANQSWYIGPGRVTHN